ncbi:MAG: TRAP transporter small permease [Vicinamibacteria bacterium]|nr:TRAP transporter small permease [Vicinamibacteria bacterium]
MVVETDASPFKLARVSRIMDRTLSYVAALLLAMMAGIVFSNVICRYFLNASLYWYEEVSRFLLLWIVFLGAVIAYIRGDHLGIDVLLIILPPRAKKAVIVLADFMVMVALLILFQGGWAMAADSLASGWVASSVPIPYGYIYMVAPVSAGLMLIHGVIKTIGDIQGAQATKQ